MSCASALLYATSCYFHSYKFAAVGDLVPYPRGRRQGAEPLQSGRRPRARSLAGGLRLVTEGYIRSPPLPPTLLLDRGDTPARPPPESARQIYMYLALDDRKMFKNIVFYSVSWPSASTTGCPWCQLCVSRGQA